MGVKEFVVGMAHRGRLNTLSNIFGKPAKEILMSLMEKTMRSKFLMEMSTLSWLDIKKKI